jgi:hypothetical protein
MLRILVVGFALTLLAGYVRVAQVLHARRSAGGTKSARILEDMRIVDNAVDQYAIDSKTAKPHSDVMFPGSKSSSGLTIIPAGDLYLNLDATPSPGADEKVLRFNSPGSKASVPVIDSRVFKLDSNVINPAPDSVVAPSSKSGRVFTNDDVRKIGKLQIQLCWAGSRSFVRSWIWSFRQVSALRWARNRGGCKRSK